MHQQPDMIGIKARKPPLATKVLHDQFHEQGILIFQKSEWKKSREVAQTTVFDVRLIMVEFLHKLPTRLLIKYGLSPQS